MGDSSDTCNNPNSCSEIALNRLALFVLRAPVCDNSDVCDTGQNQRHAVPGIRDPIAFHMPYLYVSIYFHGNAVHTALEPQ